MIRSRRSRIPGNSLTAWLTLAFLAFVLVTMAFTPTGRWVLASLVIIIPLLIIGWFSFRKRIQEAAQGRQGHTGTFPVIAERPATATRRTDNGQPRT